MEILVSLLIGLGCLFLFADTAEAQFESDVLATSAGDVTMTFLGHGTLMLAFNGKIIHVDPFSHVADFTKLPKADLILITHEHPDHLDLKALAPIRKDDTIVVLTKTCANQLEGGIVMENGDVQSLLGIEIKAVPAYNMVHKRPDGGPYHPKGIGNGYILKFGDKRVYIAGDTENIPEMKTFGPIDCAFLPMNLPYTMSPEMAADAAMSLKPKILYPYHFGKTNTQLLVDLLKDQTSIEVRIRKLQ